MTFRKIYRAAFALSVMSAAVLFPIVGLNQSKPSSTQSPSQDDVIRVNTELVQTDVTVFDKKGRFVDGLTASDFELVIDGKPQDISFFERVAFYNTERGRDADPSIADNPAAMSARQRTVMFFVDDLHLSPTSIVHTRKSLLNFVNQGMLPRDQVAITSSSGQIGFLQQFTDDRTVLQAAVARLNYRANAKLDMEKPPMSEFQASKIQEGDESAISYYVAEMLKQNCIRDPQGGVICFVDAQAARNLVIQRARQITMNTAPDTKNTLMMLEGLMRTAAQLPGRKLMFLISDGFYLNDPQTGSKDRIKKITDAAGRAGVVIYTLDARGLVTEALDVLNDRPIDSEGLTMGATMGDIAASQDGLNALARDTGGEAFRNTNRPMAEWVRQVLDENSTYYILAWRPLTDDQKGRGFKDVKIRVKGRPELTARMRRGYFRTTPLPMLSVKGKADKGITERENDMRVVIDAPIEQRELKAALMVSLAPMPGVGTRVLATVEIDRRGLAFDLFDGKPAADVDIGGIFYDDKGKPKNSFVGRLRVSAASASELQEPAVYRFQAWLPAGLYQVRVGLRDTRSGKTGSAVQWIKVPAL
ncbi:MAG TPA: VWA domain-containing protein [Pyrinomonadaceae bacterium]|nr:VWA domain-containing protein [Pyrinomonadaceae bacterium]